MRARFALAATLFLVVFASACGSGDGGERGLKIGSSDEQYDALVQAIIHNDLESVDELLDMGLTTESLGQNPQTLHK